MADETKVAGARRQAEGVRIGPCARFDDNQPIQPPEGGDGVIALEDQACLACRRSADHKPVGDALGQVDIQRHCRTLLTRKITRDCQLIADRAVT
ncbi:hypothetical protein D3C73_830650 [compost metagenome]